MIKHIVMFRLKDSAEGRGKRENLGILKTVLESLPAKIPGIKCFEVGMNEGESKSASDIVLYSEFDTMQDLEGYRRHPEHLKVVEMIEKICSERRVVDYKV